MKYSDYLYLKQKIEAKRQELLQALDYVYELAKESDEQIPRQVVQIEAIKRTITVRFQGRPFRRNNLIKALEKEYPGVEFSARVFKDSLCKLRKRKFIIKIEDGRSRRIGYTYQENLGNYEIPAETNL